MRQGAARWRRLRGSEEERGALGSEEEEEERPRVEGGW